MNAYLSAHRASILWFAAMAHRLSGIGLAAFLPLHFLALGLALRGEAALEGFLRWSDMGVVKLAESGLVFLLVVHLLGGLRLLLVENFSWRSGQSKLAAGAAALAGLVAFLFLIRVL